MSSPPFAAPGASEPTPRALGWFKLYAGALASSYALGTVLVVVASLRVMGTLAPPYLPLALAMAAMAALHGVSAAAPRVPWSWTLANVVLVLGTASCLLPLALPLLVAWQKPLVKAAYRRL